MAIQRILIRHVLEPLARLMERIPEKFRSAGFVAACLGIIVQFFGRGSGMLQYRYLIYFAVGCLCLGVMILCSLKTGMRAVSFRKGLMTIWLGIGGMMLLSGALYNVNNLPEAMLFLVAYPVVFIIWNNTEHSTVFKLLFRSVEISFWLYLGISLLFYPVNEVRYRGLFSNINGTAGYLALVVVCLLAQCLHVEKLTGSAIRKILLLGISVALLLYTSSRTGLLQIMVVAVVAVVMWLIRLRKQNKKYFFRNLALIAVSVVVFFNTAIYIFQFGYTASHSAYSFVQSLFSEGNPSATDPSGTGPTEPSQPVIRPGDSMENIEGRLDTDGLTIQQISTGRTAIWKGYLKQLNLFGHPDSGQVVFMHNGEEKVYTSTHMTILQISYENGIIAGVLYLLFNLAAGICSIFYALRNKEDPYAMVPLLISVAYGVYSLLASTGISFWYMGTFFYYLVQFPLMIRSEPGSEAQGSK